MLDLTSRTVVPLLISSITAAAVALTIRGLPIIAISLTPDDAFRLNQIPLFVLLGIFCGLMSYYFTTVNARVGAFFKKIDSPYKKWLIGGSRTRHPDLHFPAPLRRRLRRFHVAHARQHDRVVQQLALLPLQSDRLGGHSLHRRHDVLQSDRYGLDQRAGGVGGTFAPSLFVGAFMGAITALVCNTLFGWNLSLVSFTLVGMAGVMSGVMEAP